MHDPYSDLAFQALKSKFIDRVAFDQFVSTISSDPRRKRFVFAASTYLFMVKRGDWTVAVDDVEPIISYFTNSYKLVGLFAIIESLSEKEHRDFYQWLSKRVTFPIRDPGQMKGYYEQYNEDHGSIRRCRKFFEKLPQSRQKQLCKAIEVNGEPLESIHKFANFLYDLRSKFVHQAKFSLQVSSPFPVFSRTGKDRRMLIKLAPGTIEDMFEEGLIAWFRD